jgi:hypothetical protein
MWIACLLILSLVSSGIANAWAANDCPYLKSPAVHDCCPNGTMAGMPVTPDDGSHHPDKGKSDCKLGQACHATPAVAPSLAPVGIVRFALSPVRVTGREMTVVVGPSTTLWRPPRAA